MSVTRSWLVVALVGIVGIGVWGAQFFRSPTADPVTVLVGSLIPIGFALGLLGVLIWIRYDDQTAVTRRTLAWCLLGATLVVAIETSTILYQQTQGVILTERALTLVNAFVRGTLLGLLFGLYDQQRRTAIRSSDESERRQARLEEFASVVAHDLRNPISVAQGYLQLAREGDEAAFDRVESALDRTERIIDDTLTLAREGATATDTAPVSLATVAREAWSTTASTDGPTETELSVEDGTVVADATRLRRLLENLFRNNVEHGSTSDRAKPADSVDHTADTSLTVFVGPTDNGFYVADDGPGIPKSERESVLEAGYSTAAEGTGFGLAIVSRIADAHGWRLSVEERDGGGAKFVFVTEQPQLARRSPRLLLSWRATR